MDKSEIIGHILLFVVWIIIIVSLVSFGFQNEKHKKLHEELGYKTIGVLQTADKYGKPKFYKSVRYGDGCNGTIQISGVEYFEEVEK